MAVFELRPSMITCTGQLSARAARSLHCSPMRRAMSARVESMSGRISSSVCRKPITSKPTDRSNRLTSSRPRLPLSSLSTTRRTFSRSKVAA